MQTVYAVKCKPQAEVLKDKFQLDYFEILSSLPGDQAVVTQAQWQQERAAKGLASTLEPLSSMAGK